MSCYPCKAGSYYIDPLKCGSCSAGTYSNFNSTECSPCPPGSIAPLDNSENCTICQENTYAMNSTYCHNCPLNTHAKPGAVVCSDSLQRIIINSTNPSW